MQFPKLKINSNWLLLGGALTLGGGAVYLSNAVITDKMAQLEDEVKRGQRMVNVVVAKRDLERGEALTEELLAVRPMPQEYVHATAVHPDEFGTYLKQRLVAPLKRGEVLLPVHTEGLGNGVFSSTLKKGHRALTFEVDAVNSVSGLLRPGDFIDLIYSGKSGDGNETEFTLPLLSQVQVLATDQVLSKRAEGTEAERGFATVTLEVTPEEASRIIQAKRAGSLTAVLRHPDDAQPNGVSAMSAASLMGGRKAVAAAERTVEYLVGGSGTGAAELQLAKLGSTVPAPRPGLTNLPPTAAGPAAAQAANVIKATTAATANATSALSGQR